MSKELPKVFISYRRNDSGYQAEILTKALEKTANVFMDVDTILPGDSFKNLIEDAISAADVILVLIGPNWLSTDQHGHRRIDNPNDFIRFELEAALAQDKILVPVLFNTPMPSIEEVPESLQRLVYHNAMVLRMGADFRADVERLKDAIRLLVSREKNRQEILKPEQTETYYSCFISYAHLDEDFCRLITGDLREIGIKVWFADEDMKGGQKIIQQIYNAIQRYDRLLLVLSEASINSNWVAKEIKRARKREQKEKKEVLFPIRLCTMDVIDNWELMEGSDDLAREVREYYIMDFAGWRDRRKYRTSFSKLRNSLRVAAGKEFSEL